MTAVPATLERELASHLTGRVVLVGVGNPLRGDDAAGCHLARALVGEPGITVLECEDTPERELLRITAGHPDTVVLADAVRLGAPAGAVAVLEAEALARYTATTHRVPLALVAGVIRHWCHARIVVLAIEPGDMDIGAGLSPAVQRTVTALAAVVRAALRSREQAAC